tara:strand:+ start:635 stop:889 length:255 start_codon:yes stop_codon:yes gene_type:complete
MGTKLFGLTEELDLDNTIIRIQNNIESKIVIIACIFISLLKIYNIITFHQFMCLFLFYIFWFSIMYFEKIVKNDEIENYREKIE